MHCKRTWLIELTGESTIAVDLATYMSALLCVSGTSQRVSLFSSDRILPLRLKKSKKQPRAKAEIGERGRQQWARGRSCLEIGSLWSLA